MEGYFKIYRKIFESDIAPKKRYSRFEAWLYLIAYANGVDKKWNGITIKRGSFVTSQLELSKTWGFSLGYINKFLNWLKSENRIEINATNKYTVITILNYHLYNPLKEESETNSENKVKTKENQSETTNKDNKDNKDNNTRVKNPCPLKEHKLCIEFLDKLAKQKNLPHGWLNFPKQLSFLHKLLKVGYSFEEIEQEAIILDKDNFMWDKWDLATITNIFDKKGRSVILNGKPE